MFPSSEPVIRRVDSEEGGVTFAISGGIDMITSIAFRITTSDGAPIAPNPYLSSYQIYSDSGQLLYDTNPFGYMSCNSTSINKDCEMTKADWFNQLLDGVSYELWDYWTGKCSVRGISVEFTNRIHNELSK
jgi:hypothetical protein